jgi:hypothetical protein
MRAVLQLLLVQAVDRNRQVETRLLDPRCGHHHRGGGQGGIGGECQGRQRAEQNGQKQATGIRE